MRTTALSVILLAGAVAAAGETPAGLPRSTPEEQGLPSAAVLAFVDGAEKTIDALHSVMVLRHGHVVAEGWWAPYRRDDPHTLCSLSKSFTSTGVGLAIADGKLSLDDTVLSFFPEDAPAAPSDNLKAMRVRDLLRMTTGQHAEDVDKFSFDETEVPLTRAFLALPVAHKPGTHFLYNTAATYMLSAIVQKVTGQTVLDYLPPAPVRAPGHPRTRRGIRVPQGICLGGYGLSMTHGGHRAVRPALPAAGRLERQAGRARGVGGGGHRPPDLERQQSRRATGTRATATSSGAAATAPTAATARSASYCIVMPEQDAVVAITSGVRDMQAVLNLVWDHLLAGMRPGALPPDEAAQKRLERKLASLSLPPPEGRPTSPLAREVSGRIYALPENDGPITAIGLEAGGDGTTLVVRSGARESRVPCGAGEWRRGGALPLSGRHYAAGAEGPVAASGAWTADDTYTAKACFYRTSFCSTLTLRFAGDEVVLGQEMNVGFGETKRPPLVGRRSGNLP